MQAQIKGITIVGVGSGVIIHPLKVKPPVVSPPSNRWAEE